MRCDKLHVCVCIVCIFYVRNIRTQPSFLSVSSTYSIQHTVYSIIIHIYLVHTELLCVMFPSPPSRTPRKNEKKNKGSLTRFDWQ